MQLAQNLASFTVYASLAWPERTEGHMYTILGADAVPGSAQVGEFMTTYDDLWWTVTPG